MNHLLSKPGDTDSSRLAPPNERTRGALLLKFMPFGGCGSKPGSLRSPTDVTCASMVEHLPKVFTHSQVVNVFQTPQGLHPAFTGCRARSHARSLWCRRTRPPRAGESSGRGRSCGGRMPQRWEVELRSLMHWIYQLLPDPESQTSTRWCCLVY